MFKFLSRMFSSTPFGLYFTDQSIQIVQLEKQSGKIKLKAIGEQHLEPGIISNGKILQEKPLVKHLRGLLKTTRPAPISSKQCIMALPEEQSFEHIFYLPASLKGGKLKKELSKLIAETIPIPFTELTYDYSTCLLGAIQVVFVVAAERQVVGQYLRVLKDHCQLTPLVLETASLSLLRNIPVTIKPNQGAVVIDIRETKISWFSLLGDNIFDSHYITKKQDNTHINPLVTDLRNSIDFFHKKTKRNIGSIIISGNQDEIAALRQAIITHVNLPIVPIEKPMVCPRLSADGRHCQFKVASGLALMGLKLDKKTKISLLK